MFWNRKKNGKKNTQKEKEKQKQKSKTKTVPVNNNNDTVTNTSKNASAPPATVKKAEDKAEEAKRADAGKGIAASGKSHEQSSADTKPVVENHEQDKGKAKKGDVRPETETAGKVSTSTPPVRAEPDDDTMVAGDENDENDRVEEDEVKTEVEVKEKEHARIEDEEEAWEEIKVIEEIKVRISKEQMELQRKQRIERQQKREQTMRKSMLHDKHGEADSTFSESLEREKTKEELEREVYHSVGEKCSPRSVDYIIYSSYMQEFETKANHFTEEKMMERSKIVERDHNQVKTRFGTRFGESQRHDWIRKDDSRARDMLLPHLSPRVQTRLAMQRELGIDTKTDGTRAREATLWRSFKYDKIEAAANLLADSLEMQQEIGNIVAHTKQRHPECRIAIRSTVLRFLSEWVKEKTFRETIDKRFYETHRWKTTGVKDGEAHLLSEADFQKYIDHGRESFHPQRFVSPLTRARESFRKWRLFAISRTYERVIQRHGADREIFYKQILIRLYKKGRLMMLTSFRKWRAEVQRPCHHFDLSKDGTSVVVDGVAVTSFEKTK